MSPTTTAPPRSRPRRPSVFLARLHFLIRFLGLTGLLVACVGLVYAGVNHLLGSWQSVAERGLATLQGEGAEALREGDLDAWATYLTVWGLAAALFALLVEVLVGLRRAASRRSAFGFFAVVQVALAALLYVGVNVLSALGVHVTVRGHTIDVPAEYARMDWTRDRRFTLPDDVRHDLQKLRDPTTIVVYLRHKTFGALTDKPDRYDYAAERQVVQKLENLVEQFREVGPEFTVEVLDVEEDGYDAALARITANAPRLHAAIEKATENSIFFHARSAKGGERIRRMSFNDFYRLDKTASEKANGGRGNLVLLAQGQGASGRGVETIARKVVNLDAKKPRIGIAVIHPFLTTRGSEAYGLRGLKEVLTAQGFEVRDIILLEEPLRLDMPPNRTVTTYEERELDRIDQQLEMVERIVERQERDEKELGPSLDPATLETLRYVLERNRKARDRLRQRRSALDEEGLLEQRRMTDNTAKFEHMLADCDLLILPRPTLYNVTAVDDRSLPLWLHNVDEAQFQAIKDFVKQGKPILGLFGPPGEPLQFFQRPAWPPAPDAVEKLLAGLGFHLGQQTVLFDAENEAFGVHRLGFLTAGTGEQVPPVLTEWKPGLGRPRGWRDVPYTRPHPIQKSLSLAARSLGPGKELELRVRHPRPVYFIPPDPKDRPSYDPEFLRTSAESWNEEAPFPLDDYVPSYRGTSGMSMDGALSLWGTLFSPAGRGSLYTPATLFANSLDLRRRGPFPIAAAIETRPPKDWYSGGEKRPEALRMAVIGQSWFLAGDDLNPAEQRLTLDTVNWLLGNDDALANDDHPWQFPRSTIEPGSNEEALWHWAMRLGLPLLFAYLGLVVLLIRRLR